MKELKGGYANINYKVTTSKGVYVVRFCKQQPLPLIAYEVQLLNDLKAIAFPTAYPYTDNKGCYIQQTDSGPSMVYEFLFGNEPGLSPAVGFEMGKAVGLLSSFVPDKKHEKENSINLGNCHSLIQDFNSCTYSYPDIFEYFIDETEFLSPYLQKEVPRGIVHGDLFPNNTIFNGEQLVGIIDFEEAALDSLLFDIGMGINGFCFQDNVLDKKLLDNFLEGYSRYRRLEEIEWELLPYYIQWGAHGMLSWHLKNDLLKVKNITQLERVRELMRRVKLLRKDHHLIIDML